MTLISFIAFSLGGTLIFWGVLDWWMNRHSATKDAGGAVLFWRVYIGALIVAAGCMRLGG